MTVITKRTLIFTVSVLFAVLLPFVSGHAFQCAVIDLAGGSNGQFIHENQLFRNVVRCHAHGTAAEDMFSDLHMRCAVAYDEGGRYTFNSSALF